MRIAKTTRRFRKDYARLKKSGRRDMQKLQNVMGQLIDGTFLDKIHRDHALQGEWQHFRDCHIEGDWVLIYQIGHDADENETVTFHATDNHSNLFS